MELDDFATAIAWLTSNEGEGEERKACLRAAEFLRKEFVRRDRESDKRIAKRFRTPLDLVQERLKEAKDCHYWRGWDKPIREDDTA